VMDWQPIETAPRDGTHYLAYWPGWLGLDTPTVTETWFGDGTYESAYESEPPDSPAAPTHWMPLPSGPLPP